MDNKLEINNLWSKAWERKQFNIIIIFYQWPPCPSCGHTTHRQVLFQMHGRNWCIGFYQTPSLHSQCDGCGYTELLNTYHFKNSSDNGFISFPCSLVIFRVLNSAIWPIKKLQHNKHQVIMETKEIQCLKIIKDETKVANTVHIKLMSVWVKVTINKTSNYLFRAVPTQLWMWIQIDRFRVQPLTMILSRTCDVV